MLSVSNLDLGTISFFPVEVISPIKELLGKYIGEVKEVYRRCSEQSVTVVVDCALKSIATIQLKCSGLVLVNIDVGGEDSSTFNHEVCKVIYTLLDFITYAVLIQVAKKIETDLHQKLAVQASKSICPIRRGGPLDRFRYLTSSGSLVFILNFMIVDNNYSFR